MDQVEIRSEALRRLRSSGYSALREVSCDAHADGVRLGGRLPSYYLKQVAQAAVAEVEGVRHVENHIEVSVRPGPIGVSCGRDDRSN